MKIKDNILPLIFAAFGFVFFIGGFYGATWHFYTAVLCFIMVGLIKIGSYMDRRV